ncbi:MAG: acyl-CoA dehydrogenase family protein [Acidimicrobiia bacterium]|nr:acyl-CoA dehydrogenase family protein [Acidimicrobiia bacterium]
MDFDMPPEAEEFRAEIRAWLDENPNPTPKLLAERGLVAPHWPKPYGLDATPIQQIVIDEELKRASVPKPQNVIGVGWAGPTLIYAGTEEQKARYLPKILTGEDIWCQLFSEPGAGSDLANISTRAVRDGDEWVVNGQKIWTSMAQFSRFGILLARTNPDAPKHEGITYFVCPMDTPGIEIRPIIEMTGTHTFNEVFMDDVRIPAANVVGEVHKGWSLGKVTLGNERVSLSGEGALWGQGPTAQDLLTLARDSGGVDDPMLRQRIAHVWAESEVLRLIRLRTVSAAVAGREPGPEASIRKALADEHGKHVFALAKDLAGSAAMLNDPVGATPRAALFNNAMWNHGYLFAPALTIGGGTAEVQRNIIGERVLGLPKDIDVEAGKTWAEAHA